MKDAAFEMRFVLISLLFSTWCAALKLVIKVLIPVVSVYRLAVSTFQDDYCGWSVVAQYQFHFV